MRWPSQLAQDVWRHENSQVAMVVARHAQALDAFVSI